MFDVSQRIMFEKARNVVVFLLVAAAIVMLGHAFGERGYPVFSTPAPVPTGEVPGREPDEGTADAAANASGYRELREQGDGLHSGQAWVSLPERDVRATQRELDRLLTGEEAFTYSDLQSAARARAVVSFELDQATGRAEVLLRDGSSYTLAVPLQDAALLTGLARSGAKVTVHEREQGPQPKRREGIPWLTVLAVVGGLAVLMALMGRFGQHLGGANMSRLGGIRENTEVSEENRPAVRFADVAGCDEAVEEVREVVEFLRDPERFQRVGAKMPTGIILWGPPGTGKTLLAKALAGESGRAFFAVAGSEFVNRFVGAGADNVRKLFEKARKSPSGAVVFIDEIDAVGQRRTGGSLNDEREQTLNQLLAELDGFSTQPQQVMVLAATNRLDTLDPALLRPGRFSRQIHVGLPDRKGRLEILRLHARGKPLAEDVDLEALADSTAECSGAILAETLNEAAILAARDRRDKITQDDLNEGLLRVLMGPEKRSQMLSEEELEIVAYHEAGHVLCAELCPTHEKAQRTSIKQRGMGLGFAQYGRRDRGLHSQQYIHEQLMCLLAGRAAEFVVFGSVSSGAVDDLQKANTLARQAIEKLGLSPKVGQVTSLDQPGSGGLSEQTRALVDQEVERLVAHAYRDAIGLLRRHRAPLDRLARALQQAKDLNRLEIVAALGLGDGVQPFEARPQLGPAQDVPVPQPAASVPAARHHVRAGVLARLRRLLDGRTQRKQLRPS